MGPNPPSEQSIKVVPLPAAHDQFPIQILLIFVFLGLDRNLNFLGILGNSFFCGQQQLVDTAFWESLQEVNKNGPKSAFGAVDQSCAIARGTWSISNTNSIEFCILASSHCCLKFEHRSLTRVCVLSECHESIWSWLLNRQKAFAINTYLRNFDEHSPRFSYFVSFH